MTRLALLSKHIVFTELEGKSPSYPRPGVIIIENGIIIKIDLIVTNYDACSLMSMYSSWNPVDYTDFYISPGLIDLNTKLEWETQSDLTRESLQGGVTCLVTEPGHYQPTFACESLYCDVCQMSIIDESTTSIPPETSVLKAYLFPPAPTIKSISNIEHTLSIAQNSGLTLIVDPTMPDPRMLYMASPHRLENVEERGKIELSSQSTVFAAAFPESLDSESSPSQSIDSDSETKCPLPNKSSSLQYSEIKPFIRHNRSISNEKPEAQNFSVIQEELPVNEYLMRLRKNSHDIYHDLDERIKQRQKVIEDLCRAETSTYRYSGSTNFLTIDVPKKSSSMTSFDLNTESPSSATSGNTPVEKIIISTEPNRRKLRPSPIQIKSAIKPDVQKDYNYFLANCPESWETMGVQKVIEHIKPNYSIHFTGISSAAAINTLRHCKKDFKSLTCDISISHLCFTSASVAVSDTRFKNSPPIRNQSNCNLIWELLKMKGIDCISSGHSFIAPSFKLTENFQQSLNGIPTAGLSLFAIWNMLNVPVSTQEQLEHYIVRLSKWLSLYPARVLQLSHERGKIEKGQRADLVIWNPFEKFILPKNWKYRETSPFVTQEMMGKVVKVYIKGQVVYENGRVLDPVGQIIRRN